MSVDVAHLTNEERQLKLQVVKLKSELGSVARRRAVREIMAEKRSKVVEKNTSGNMWVAEVSAIGKWTVDPADDESLLLFAARFRAAARCPWSLLFKRVSPDSDGRLSYLELKRLVRHELGMKTSALSTKELQSLYLALDPKKRGYITMAEWGLLMRRGDMTDALALEKTRQFKEDVARRARVEHLERMREVQSARASLAQDSLNALHLEAARLRRQIDVAMLASPRRNSGVTLSPQSIYRRPSDGSEASGGVGADEEEPEGGYTTFPQPQSMEIKEVLAKLDRGHALQDAEMNMLRLRHQASIGGGSSPQASPFARRGSQRPVFHFK